MSTVTRPPLKYFGSKWRLATWIMGYFPPHHISYVEPFGGSASILLRKEPSQLEVYNDMNRDVVTFFRVLRDDPQELLRVIEATPYAREEYQLSLTTPESPISDMERARRFFVRAWQGFSGSATQKRNGWRYQQKIYPGRDSKVETDWHALERLETAAVRMRHVQIENDDALKVITRFDSPETLFYIDPPYPASTRSKSWGKCAYTHELTTQDHVHLLNLIRRIKGYVIISCYDSALYKEMLSDWRSFLQKTVNNRTTPSEETIYISPNIPAPEI